MKWKTKIGDKYNIQSVLGGKEGNELYVMFEPKDGEYLTGKMDEITNEDRESFKKKLNQSRQGFIPDKQNKNEKGDEMEYFLNIDEKLIENSQDLFDTQYPLCKRSFGTVYPKDGMKILNNVITKHDDYVEHITIANSKGDVVPFNEFAEMLEENTVLDQ